MIVGTACSDLHTLSCPVPGLSMDPEINTMHNKCFEMHGVQILEHFISAKLKKDEKDY